MSTPVFSCPDNEKRLVFRSKQVFFAIIDSFSIIQTILFLDDVNVNQVHPDDIQQGFQGKIF